MPVVNHCDYINTVDVIPGDYHTGYMYRYSGGGRFLTVYLYLKRYFFVTFQCLFHRFEGGFSSVCKAMWFETKGIFF